MELLENLEFDLKDAENDISNDQNNLTLDNSSFSEIQSINVPDVLNINKTDSLHLVNCIFDNLN